jgi:hypothetical protein
MQMIPSQPIDTKSSAELRVFDQLRKAFSSPAKGHWFAMHSLNLPRHTSQRFGEIDFIVCGPEGLFVFEVKGGGVSCRDGRWQSVDRTNETHHLRQSPFQQAENNLHGLRDKLHPHVQPFIVGYGVILPDTECIPDSAEWDRSVLADARDFRQFEKWLEKFISHWRSIAPKKSSASAEQVKQLKQMLRPDFESVMRLHVSAHEAERRIAQLTDDQMRFIDVVAANDRVICNGGAGTGKTMMAIELAKRWTASGQNVLLACHSPWLKSYLGRLSNDIPGLTVSLVESLSVTARRAGLEKFDALIVDEGQDVLNMEALDQLEKHLNKGLAEGRWCFFHDTNNQSGLCGSYVPDAYAYLESLAPARIPLTTNCRNTKQILRSIQECLHADLGNPGVGDGPAIRQTRLTEVSMAGDTLLNELQMLREQGFSDGDITVLSGLPYGQSSISALPADWQRKIRRLDEASAGMVQRTQIGFAEISHFKGLESEVVILVDLAEPAQNSAERPLHYVGMSRARALLSVIYLPT